MSQIAIAKKYNDYIIVLPEPKMTGTANHIHYWLNGIAGQLAPSFKKISLSALNYELIKKLLKHLITDNV